jgi:hypothetical protein
MPEKDRYLLDNIKVEDALRLLERLKKESIEKDYGQSYVDQLFDSCHNFFETDKFEKGQLVIWKKGLKNKRLPHEKQPAVVVEVLEKPLYAEYESGTPYFQEPLDIALAMIGEHDDFIIFYYDSRRFEPFNEINKA